MNIWNKKYNKTNKNTYELSKELNIPEQKIKEIIKGEREVPRNDVDRVNGAFVSNSIGISSFERAMMEKFFMDNDIQDLKKKFGYISLIELSNAMDIGVSTVYYLRSDKIKALSDKILKKAYDFFQDDWNKKVTKETTQHKSKSHYYYLSKEKLSKEVIDWYENTDIQKLRINKGLNVKRLLNKLGFDFGYYSILCKLENKHKLPTTNYIMVQQLYNYYHGLELLNVRARNENELYGNINTPTFEYEQPSENVDVLDIEPNTITNDEEITILNRVIEQRNDVEENEKQEEKEKMEVVEPIEKGTAMYIEYEEYTKVVEELNRYKFLIDMLMKQERK